MTDPKTIVIVDDEPDTANMLAEMMRLSGFNILISYGGQTATRLIAEAKPDAVILDLVMPDLPGLDVLAWMRNTESLAHIPVIVVSASQLPSDEKASLDGGASLFLPKPVSYGELKKAVDLLLLSN